MTAHDGLPFSIVCTSYEIREGLKVRGFFDLPVPPTTVTNIVMEYSSKVRQAMTSEMSQQMKNRKKFSLNFDKWTSGANKCYMNISVHAGNSKFWSLNFLHISGSMPAQKYEELVEGKLIRNGYRLKKTLSA